MFAVRVFDHQPTLVLSNASLKVFAAARDSPDIVTIWDNERI